MANWPPAEVIWEAANEVVNGTRMEIAATAAVFEQLRDAVLTGFEIEATGCNHH